MAGVGAAGKAFQGELAVTLSTNQSGAQHLQKAFRLKSLPVLPCSQLSRQLLSLG